MAAPRGPAAAGQTKALHKPGRIGRGEQFCTDAVGHQAHEEQRLGACPLALLPVRPILQVSGPSRGWLSVWGSFCMLRNSALRRRGLQLAIGLLAGHCRSAASYDSTSRVVPGIEFRGPGDVGRASSRARRTGDAAKRANPGMGTEEPARTRPPALPVLRRLPTTGIMPIRTLGPGSWVVGDQCNQLH